MYLKGIKACCALVFVTVLAICSKISEEQCLKHIPDLVRNRTVLLIDLEVTTYIPRSDSNRKLHDDHVSKRGLCIYMYMKKSFIAEATNKKQHVNENHLPSEKPPF